jgi:hypothetical protein
VREFLFEYHGVLPTTWAYLSSLLMIGLFFKFGRFWSLRNLDLVMLIGLAPGLLLIHNGNQQQAEARADDALEAQTEFASDADDADGPDVELAAEFVLDQAESEKLADELLANGRKNERAGYLWLFVAGVLWLVRLLLDPTMVRRPLLAPNLSVGGLTFIGAALFIFLMANVLARQASVGVAQSGSQVMRMDALLAYQQQQGPGYAVLGAIPPFVTKVLVVASHLGVVIGLILVGHLHFGNATNGIGAATLYLMLPYTSQMTGRLDHVLPAALLIFAVLFYRRPLIAGVLLGAACGCVYYPLFLLPLWISFYWKRGLFRFVVTVAVVLTIMAVGLISTPESPGFLPDLQRMFGVFKPATSGLLGIWDTRIDGWDPSWRLPVLAAFVVMSLCLIFWPSPKNLGSLLSCSAAVMLASQFWHGYGGGLYMAWYLPLLLLTVFRPNLEDRGVQSVLMGNWFARSATRSLADAQAA